MASSAPALKAGSPLTITLVSLAMLSAIAFWFIAALHYLYPSGEVLNQYPGMTLDRKVGLLSHIFGGSLALFTGPFLLWLGQTRQRLGLHRRLGYCYLAGASITCLAAYYLALTTPIGFLFASGLFGMALACTASTSLAFLAIRRRNIAQHREWMIRSYITIFAFVFFRLIFGTLDAAGFGGPDGQILRLSFAAWSSWPIPLLVTEVCLQWPKISRSPASADH